MGRDAHTDDHPVRMMNEIICEHVHQFGTTRFIVRADGTQDFIGGMIRQPVPVEPIGQVEPPKPPPPLDEAEVAEQTDEAERRGWRWLIHGGIGVMRWWLRIDRAQREIASKRLNICQTCPEWRKGLRCRKCGCVLAAKVTDASENCPIGRW